MDVPAGVFAERAQTSLRRRPERPRKLRLLARRTIVATFHRLLELSSKVNYLIDESRDRALFTLASLLEVIHQDQ
jgi:hypothetical protein